MQLGSVHKLIVSCVLIVCLSVLMAIDTLPVETGMLPITAITFYIVGNGRASRSGEGVQSILEPRPSAET